MNVKDLKNKLILLSLTDSEREYITSLIELAYISGRAEATKDIELLEESWKNK